MNKIKLTIISIIFLYTNLTASIAAEVNGAADVYKIKMNKIELCTGHTAGDFDDTATSPTQCQNAVTIGESAGGVEVDIASVDAGAVAGAFGNPMVLPLGETYTHLRVTIDRKFTVKTFDNSPISTSSDGGSSKTDKCLTKSVTSSYPTNEATNKYTHKPVVAESETGSSEEMNLYFLNGEKASTHNNSDATFVQCTNADCSQNSTVNGRSWWNTYLDTEADLAANGDSNIAQSIHRASAATDDFVLVYKLTSPYTVSLIPPTIDIAFGTLNSIGVQEVSTSRGSGTPSSNDGMCSFYVAGVKVEITIK